MYLTVERLTCGYTQHAVLKDLSLDVQKGEFLAIVGPNGSGKSTLLKAISRTLPVAAGRILLEGRNIARLSARDLACQMAVVAQETAVEFDFTAEEVVMLGRLPHLARFRRETPADYAAVERAMLETNTTHLARRLITELSGGERQRVLVARALAQEPSLLLLDEPTAHLDIGHQVELLDLVRRLNRERGLTVIAVLHDLNLAAQYARRLVMLKDGQCCADGKPSAVVTESTVSQVYGSRVRVMVHPEEGSPHVILLSGVRGA